MAFSIFLSGRRNTKNSSPTCNNRPVILNSIQLIAIECWNMITSNALFAHPREAVNPLREAVESGETVAAKNCYGPPTPPPPFPAPVSSF